MTPQKTIKQLNILLSRERYLLGCSSDEHQHSQAIEALEVAKQAVEKSEVKHGKNITKIKPVDEFECSECGFICEICENIYYDDCICHREYNPEFCPNCGAKIDKE